MHRLVPFELRGAPRWCCGPPPLLIAFLTERCQRGLEGTGGVLVRLRGLTEGGGEDGGRRSAKGDATEVVRDLGSLPPVGGFLGRSTSGGVPQ
ncbi:hypothetical protein NDU88_003146 [Pleurodeles waltl]|uniref:Uncharacterized protein n=1 Tax=Pleurodeles waltl TaxID=8319 RepID=A0AAV7LEF0_PLEWA|nr:hypothetical protein NDU88_003146 [Pleurodeles waltl]